MPAPWIDEGCPWYDLHRWMPPDIEWCEAATCSVISEPANTWSNLAYIALGLWVLARSRGAAPGLGRAFGPAMVLVGVFSFAYHASANFIGQWLDFVGMFAFAALPLTVNVRRLRPMPAPTALRLYLGLVTAASLSVIALYALHVPVQLTIAAFVVATLVLEALATARGGRAQDYGALAFAVGTLVLALFVRELDRQRLWCEPEAALLQGHAIWHGISAVSIAACWRFYRQFDVERSPAGD